MRRGSNGPRVGSYNRKVVLDAVREVEGVSRVELAKRTGLTAQTVSNIVRRLIDEDLVVESGQLQGQMGKPRTLLRINEAAYHAVGVHFDPHEVTCVVVDLGGRVVARATRTPRPGSGPSSVVTLLVKAVEAALGRAGLAPESVVGVGIASPGAIDAAGGEVIGPPNLPGWGRVPLRDTVAARLGLPVSLDNDATAAAMGERWVGGAGRSGSFAYIYLGTGVGCGLILSDQVFRGSSGNAGELGHVSIDVRGRLCHCGNRGCLEAYISPAAIRADLGGVDLVRGGPQDWSDFARAVAAGDPGVTRAMDQAASRLADATVSLVNLLDLPRIVIGGRGLQGLAVSFSATVQARVNAHAMARGARSVEVTPTIVGENAAAIGAASLVLHSSYSPHLVALLADVP